MAEGYRIFDRALVRQHTRKRAGGDALYLFREAANGIRERLLDINRDSSKVLAIGPLRAGEVLGVKPELFIATDGRPDGGQDGGPDGGLDFDAEQLPIKDQSFDLVLSNLDFHWVNDLPGALVQVRRALKPDGVFLAAMLGGETLRELRQSLLFAEAETTGGASPRISPFADLRDAGDLLARAGFAMPVADIETLTVSYDHPLKLMRDLRKMGETNALLGRRKTFSRKDTMARAIDYYFEHFSNEEGRIRATFQIIYLTGWAPGPNQPKPLRPGSANVSLKDALKP